MMTTPRGRREDPGRMYVPETIAARTTSLLQQETRTHSAIWETENSFTLQLVGSSPQVELFKFIKFKN